MNRLREKTTAILLIAIFMISAFAIIAPVSALTTYYVATTGSDTTGDGSSGNPWKTISHAVSQVSDDDTIIVTAGTYDEQVLIDKSLTLEGAGDTTIIQPPAVALTPTSNIPWIGGGSHTMSAIVSVEATGGIVTVKNLKIDGSLIPSKSTTWVAGLVYLETGGTVEGVTVNGNPTMPDRTAGIFAAAITESVDLEVTGCTVQVYTRAGIYALGASMTADYHHNLINGPGPDPITTGVPNGMFFLTGATGSATYNIVTYLGYAGETYRSTGIGTYQAGAGIVFSHNEISNVQNAFALAYPGGGGVTVEYNDVHDSHTGVRIESGSANNLIRYNDIHDNIYAIRCDSDMGDGNEAHYNNFVNNIGYPVYYDYVGAVSVQTGATVTLDATLNWWGHASGPSGEYGRVNKAGKVIGKGDSVSDNVNWDQWLPQPVDHTPHHPVPPGLDR